MIAIIDYGMGNVGSVKNAVKTLGYEVKICYRKTDMQKASHLILPGVGAFGEGIKNLLERGLVDILCDEVLMKRKPFLGICLGMQLLAEEGEEGGAHKGLGWLKGRVHKFAIDEKQFPLPHVGWNDVSITNDSFLFRSIGSLIFYFVHSYYFMPVDTSVVVAESEYGERFAVAIQRDHICGVQFHPEKSQQSGLNLLHNFLRYHE